MTQRTLIVVALRRSGTTAFWRAFRRDPRFRCYNEPFNPSLSHVGDDSWVSRSSHDEYRELLAQDPRLFWGKYSPIAPEIELQDSFSDRQMRYFKWLASSGQNVCLETTRCVFRIAQIREIFPTAVLVHLYRPAAEFARSVMLPSLDHIHQAPPSVLRAVRSAKRRAANTVRRRMFWHTRRVNGFGYQAVMRDGSRGSFAIHLADAGMDSARVLDFPAVGRLLAFWKIAYDRAERTGRESFGERFLSIPFGEFATQPRRVMDDIYDALGMSRPAQLIDLSFLRRPGTAYQPDHLNWQKYGRLIGLSRELMSGSRGC